MYVQSYIDYQLKASEYKVGDVVRLMHPIRGTALAQPGKVTAVLEGIGFCDVEFPQGNFRVDATELVRVDLEPPQADTSLDTWERRKASLKEQAAVVGSFYRTRLKDLWRVSSGLADNGIDQLDAYNLLFQRYSRAFSDTEIKNVVEASYEASQSRQGMYWKAKGRQYVPTKSEMASGVFHCPRCKCEMDRTVYKKWTKLYACPDCLFLIKPADILDSLDDETREEAEEQGLNVSDPSKAFNEWL